MTTPYVDSTWGEGASKRAGTSGAPSQAQPDMPAPDAYPSRPNASPPLQEGDAAQIARHRRTPRRAGTGDITAQGAPVKAPETYRRGW
jgi:hypothetical protein